MTARSGSISESAIAIVPARGGSKGIPGKNLARVGDRSLLQRSIDACLGAHFVDLCVVSTDDDAIQAEALRCGATVIRRPALLATDSASSESAILHVLDELELKGIELPNITLMVQCTSPFISSGDLDAVVSNLVEEGGDSCFTASRSHRFLWRIGRDGDAIAVNHSAERRLPRQELEPEFLETGAAYGFRTKGFRARGNRFFGKIVIAETDPNRSLEVDDPFDLECAQAFAAQIES